MESDQTLSVQAADHAISETRRMMEKAGFSTLKLAKELKIIAFSDIKNHITIDEGGAIQARTFGEMGAKTRALKKVKEITKITEAADGTKLFKDSRLEFELYDKLDAIKFAAALMGMEQPKEHRVGFDNSIMALVTAQLGGGKDE